MIFKNMTINANNLLMILFLIALCSSCAFAQCSLTLDKVPAFHGLKPGMTVEQVSQYLNLKLPLKEKLNAPDILKPELKVDVGEKIVTLKNILHPNFKGVSRLQLTFFENALYDIELDYSKSASDWKDLSEFQDRISKTLNLPRSAWQDLPVLSSIQCGDFVITANIMDWEPYGTTVSFSNTVTVQKIIALAKRKLRAGGR